MHSDLNETFCVGNVNAQKKNLIKASLPHTLTLIPHRSPNPNPNPNPSPNSNPDPNPNPNRIKATHDAL